MKALTLWQPYASLVAIKVKPFETKSFPPPAKLIGQRIAIHAAVRPIQVTWRTLPLATRDAIARAIRDGGITGPLDDLPHGAVVCTAVLAGAYQCGAPVPGTRDVEIRQHRGPLGAGEYLETDLFGDYSPGRWAWLLTDVQPLDPPVPAKGKQGWWEWDEGRVAA